MMNLNKWAVWLVLTGGLLLGACSKPQLDMENPDVELFVEMLEKGTYQQKDSKGMPVLPHFTKKNIPELLEYASDLQLISSFPAFYMTNTGKVRLGECLLWIVESIRLGFPASMGCNMVRADATNYEAIYFLSDQEVLDALECYKAWWNKEQSDRLLWDSGLYRRDPLEGSGFRWW